MVKNLPAVLYTQVQSLGQEYPLEKGMATHSSILAWRSPKDRGAWWATVHGVKESDTTEQLTCFLMLENLSFHVSGNSCYDLKPCDWSAVEP